MRNIELIHFSNILPIWYGPYQILHVWRKTSYLAVKNLTLLSFHLLNSIRYESFSKFTLVLFQFVQYLYWVLFLAASIKSVQPYIIEYVPYHMLHTLWNIFIPWRVWENCYFFGVWTWPKVFGLEDNDKSRIADIQQQISSLNHKEAADRNEINYKKHSHIPYGNFNWNQKDN